MELRKLGSTDINISPIGLGCWQFSNNKGIVGSFWKTLDYTTEREIVRESIAGGINWFDTAEAYGWGESEIALSTVLKELGNGGINPLIATKWWPVLRAAGNIGRTIDTRLDKLNGYPIDLYQIHNPTSRSSVKSQMKQMCKLLEAGKIRSVGVSNFSADRMLKSHNYLKECGTVLAANQMRYSLLDRRIEFNGVLDTAKENGITIIAYSPLEQGILTGKFHAAPEKIKERPGPRKLMKGFRSSGLQKSANLIKLLEEIAGKYNVSAAQVALNWVISYHGETVVAIPGATRIRHAKDNVGAMKLKLSQDELERIDKESLKVARK